ncbi:MAG TPA: phosphate regulon sensor histidine kinase PhoR [Xanthomonadales bacterium]|nr:phosphate regulon sensor histidine kinase PhoR [Xanthomonadales bacterium]
MSRSLEEQPQLPGGLPEDTLQQGIRKFTDAFPDATLILDRNDRITWCNQAAIAALKFRMPEDLGLAVTHLIRHPEFAQWLHDRRQPVRKLEMPSPADDNTWLQVNAVPLQDNERLLILRDITSIHNVEQMRRDFVANISHELRTPVTVLMGYLEIMKDHSSEDVATVASRMLNQANLMKDLLDDLLELSRLQSQGHNIERREVDMAALLSQLHEQAEELSRGRHTLVFECEPGLKLTGSAANLESAFRNLIFNAINYTPQGGRITVQWKDSVGGPCFSVTDTGIGIPQRHIPRLTERFYRVSPDRSKQSGGTGLGLAIVKHVLNAHDARLLVTSELGEGSVFTCQFPRPGTAENA